MPIKIYLQAAAFSPVDIPGLKLWLKADTGVYKDAGTTLAVEGESIQQWNDQSGNANHVTQATAAARPIFKVNIVNGQPVVRFDGLDDWMATGAFTLNQPEMIFVVWKRAIGVIGYLIDGLAENSGSLYAGVTTINDVRLYAGASLVGAIGNDGAFLITGALANGASSQIWKNGTSIATGDSGASNMGGVTLGATGTSHTDPLAGDTPEIIIYDSVLSNANRNQVTSYLGTKYNIAVV